MTLPRIFTNIVAAISLLLAPAVWATEPGGDLEQSQTAPAYDQVQEDQPVQAVMFYSNWCGACQVLDPKVEAAKPVFAERPVDFVRFDFSFAMVKGKELRSLAEEKNLANIYAKNKGKVGFLLLVDPDTETVLDVLTMRDSLAVIIATIDKRLQRGKSGVQN